MTVKFLTDNETAARKRQEFVKQALKNHWSLRFAKMVAVKKYPYTMDGDLLDFNDPRLGYGEEK